MRSPTSCELRPLNRIQPASPTPSDQTTTALGPELAARQLLRPGWLECLGIPAIAPSEAIGSFARSLRQIAETAPGNGTASGIWPNAVNFAFTGSRVGGNLTELTPEWSPGSMPMPCLDSCLYPEGKAILSATLMRAANGSNDPALRSLGLALMDQALDELTPAATPLGKSQGEYLGRISSGLAYVVSEGFADGFE